MGPAGAGDLLVDFTSRNGNWFLEELCNKVANLDAIINLLNGCQWVSGCLRENTLVDNLFQERKLVKVIVRKGF